MFTSSLPVYSGPYSVATTDLELPVPSPDASFSPALLRSTGQPALKLDTVLFTLYYPANDHRVGSGKHQHWLQRPVAQTADGYARFLGKNRFLVKLFLWIAGSRVRLPADGDAGIAFKLPPPKDDVEMREKNPFADPEKASSTLEADATSNSFPLVVFSHGLSGTRTTYSQWCGEIASRGYVVAAIEHRDGSGPISVVRLGSDGEERIVDYIRPEEHLVWPDGSTPQTALEFRLPQLDLRLAEVREVLSVIKRINAGEGAAVAAENRRKDYGGEGVVGKWLPAFRGKIGLGEEGGMVMAGHSFGGATTIQALRAGSTSFPFTRGIALDPWLEPIPPAPSSSDDGLDALTSTSTHGSHPAPTSSKAGDKVPLDIKVPLLVINSEGFTLWRSHYKLVKGLVDAVQGGKGWLLTLVGSIHTTFSDLPILVPIIARRSGARVDPLKGTAEIVKACTEFLAEKEGEVLSPEVVPGDENGARPGEGGPKEGGKKDEKVPMEGEVGSWRMHVKGKW